MGKCRPGNQGFYVIKVGSEWFSELTDLDFSSNYTKEYDILGKCLSFLTWQCLNFLISKKRLISLKIFVKAN